MINIDERMQSFSIVQKIQRAVVRFIRALHPPFVRVPAVEGLDAHS